MTARHLEFLVEEPSMEAFLKGALPRLLQDCTFQTHAFQGKRDLLRKLPFRLRGYGHWLSDDQRIVVVVDRDSDECRALKQRLEEAAAAAGLRTRSQTGDGCWQVVNRIVIEELEAWYFGDWEAVRGAYPKVSPTIPNQARYGVPDAIRGGTWEAFERILQRHGYYKTGLPKVEAAKTVAGHIDPAHNRSESFLVFRDALVEAVS